MDKKEFMLFAAAIRTYYPKEKILPNQQSMELWFNHLADIPYKVAAYALERWVNKNKWSPAISDIREEVINIQWENLEKAEQGSEAFIETYKSIKRLEGSKPTLKLIGGAT